MSAEEREIVLERLRYAVELLEESMSIELIPEVGSNIAYALTKARSPGDVAAVEGRIVRLSGRAHAVGQVAFGASDHVARIILTAIKFDPHIRSAANIRYNPEIVKILEDMFLEVCSFDRAGEPPGIQTMDWGVASCCKSGVPDVIFDCGGIGKEPMIRLLGEDPVEVAKKVIKVSGRII
ncbi:MAG TPA: thiamine-phosphate synthase family protein [Methanoregulaceae archaeon]|nr:thiamine-phosphate synthase family protein [Methanoregulaceae archaeon]